MKHCIRTLGVGHRQTCANSGGGGGMRQLPNCRVLGKFIEWAVSVRGPLILKCTWIFGVAQGTDIIHLLKCTACCLADQTK